MTAEVNCAVDCINGCALGNECPNQAYQTEASKFIQETSLDQMLEMAEEAVRKKRMAQAAEGPMGVFPEDGIQPPT